MTDNYEQYSLFLYYSKNNKKKDKDNKEEEKVQDPYFILICITSILGFLVKYILDILISYYKNKFDEKYDSEEISDTIIMSDNSTYIEKNIEIFEHDKKLFIWIVIIYSSSIII